MPEIKRFAFTEIFQLNSDGTLQTRRTISVNGVAFGPNVAIGPGVALGGIDFHKLKNLDIAAEEVAGGVLEIKGFFPQ